MLTGHHHANRWVGGVSPHAHLVVRLQPLTSSSRETHGVQQPPCLAWVGCQGGSNIPSCDAMPANHDTGSSWLIFYYYFLSRGVLVLGSSILHAYHEAPLGSRDLLHCRSHHLLYTRIFAPLTPTPIPTRLAYCPVVAQSWYVIQGNPRRCKATWWFVTN